MPEGAVTFLFSDVEGSTQLLERHGARMGTALARHHSIFEHLVSLHGGRIFETVGDAIYAAFAQPSQAVHAALDAHRHLAAEDWGSIGRLAVRIAVHTGEVERRGDHYFGPALFRAARLQALGYGEQTLLSAVTVGLVKDALPDGASMRDLGRHRLKDLAEAEHVFQLVHPELRSDFPPLKSLDAHPHNLPIQLSTFVGRERELADLGSLIQEHRLVTVLGPGGIGKTRLALQAAAEQIDRFSDGVFFVDLAPSRQAEQVPSAIAATLGIHERPGTSLGELLAGHLRSRTMLLVLDNLEQLLPGAGPTVAELLATTADLRVLATTRAPLRVRGEREYAAPALAVGSSTHHDAEPPAAVALFMERGRAIDGSLELTDESGPLIVDICRRLDGLPLAIELAAARLRVFNLAEVHRRLSDSLPLLAGGPRDLPERQQTLHNTIGWSEELLGPDERAMFAELGVFVGGFTLEAAEGVSSATDATDALDALTTLVEGSLVRRTDAPDEELRYGMLETVREYALLRLVQNGRLDKARRGHARYFMQLVAREGPLLGGVAAVAAHRRLRVEWPNVTAALTAFREWRDWASLATMAGQLGQFWRGEGIFTEAREWLQLVVEHAVDLPASVMVDVYWSLGHAVYGQGDYEEAQRNYRREAELAGALGDRHREARARLDLGGALMFAGRYDEVERLHRDAMKVAAEVGDVDLHERARHNLGRFLGLHAGRDEEGSALLAQVRAEASARGDDVMVAYSTVNLGEVANRHRRYDDARPLLEQGLALAAEIENRHLLAGVELDLGELEVAMGNAAVADRWLTSALRSFVEMGEKAGILECVEQLAFSASVRGDHSRAIRLLAGAEFLRRSIPVGYRPRKDKEYERAERAAAGLPVDLVDEARSRGRDMTLDDLVAYALDALPATSG